MKTYQLKPTMTLNTLNTQPVPGKLAPREPAKVPPHQPLPQAVIDPGKPMLKLGLDGHLGTRFSQKTA